MAHKASKLELEVRKHTLEQNGKENQQIVKKLNRRIRKAQ